jgi:hypothetical protein
VSYNAIDVKPYNKTNGLAFSALKNTLAYRSAGVVVNSAIVGLALGVNPTT